MEDARLVMTISSQEKIEVLTKMMNPEQTFFNKVHIGNRKDVERIGYDSRLLAAIQPAGGIRFHPAYIRTGSNYGAILTIYDWKSELDAHWLSPLVNQNNLIVSADFGAADAREVKRLIDRSFTEQKIRFRQKIKMENRWTRGGDIRN